MIDCDCWCDTDNGEHSIILAAVECRWVKDCDCWCDTDNDDDDIDEHLMIMALLNADEWYIVTANVTRWWWW